MELRIRDICGTSARPCKKHLGTGILDSSSPFFVIQSKLWKYLLNWRKNDLSLFLLPMSIIGHDQCTTNCFWIDFGHYTQVNLDFRRSENYAWPFVSLALQHTTGFHYHANISNWRQNHVETVLKWGNFGKHNNPHLLPPPPPPPFKVGVCCFPLVALDGGRKSFFSLF